jgi:hypothetical protein
MDVFAVLLVVFAAVFLGGALCLSLVALWSANRLWPRRHAPPGHGSPIRN